MTTRMIIRAPMFRLLMTRKIFLLFRPSVIRIDTVSHANLPLETSAAYTISGIQPRLKNAKNVFKNAFQEVEEYVECMNNEQQPNARARATREALAENKVI